MAVKINIPGALRTYTNNQTSVEIAGSNVNELLEGLISAHPDLKKHLFQQDGRLRSFVNLFVNDEDIRHLNNLETEVKDSDDVQIIPSIAGGIN